ncbi:MAG: rod shape-determining protein RodA [Pseudomonadota bacterium]
MPKIPQHLFQLGTTPSYRRRVDLLSHWHLDLPLLCGILLLAASGFVLLYSADGGHTIRLERQMTHFGLACGVLIWFAQISPASWQRWGISVYIFSLILLVAVLFLGETGKGAQRWLNIGGFRFQPAESAKLAVPLMIATLLARHPLPPSGKHLMIASGLIAVPVILIAQQPDLGTALLVASAGIFVLFLAGISWRLIFSLFGLAAVTAPLLWLGMHDYQRQRVLTFLSPEQDPLGAGYHIIQSKIAIGSGGLYGKGLFQGTQSQLHFLPERHTDFIFAVLAEELGLLGITGILCLYLTVILRGLYIAHQAQDNFSRLLGGALILVFFVYLYVNTGMVSGLLPIVGVPLPLVSYGGTSLITLMAAFGILMSIHTHRKLLPG